MNGIPEMKTDLKLFMRVVNIMANLKFVFQGSQKWYVRVPISWKDTDGRFSKFARLMALC